MQYTEVDIKIREVDPLTEIIIAKLNLIDYETFYENENGVKCYIQSQNFNKKSNQPFVDYRFKSILDALNAINKTYN